MCYLYNNNGIVGIIIKFCFTFQMTCPTFGHQVGSVTLRAAKIAATWNQRQSMVGSGQRIELNYRQQIAFPTLGPTIHGRRQVTRNNPNPIMPNSTSIAQRNPAYPFSITSTMTELHGTMLPVITKNHSSAKIPMNF